MPYVLIDAIGIKKAFIEDRQTAIDMCQHLWELAKNRAFFENSDIKWITFSDSILISWKAGIIQSGQPLLRWLRSILAEFRVKIGTQLYAIGNQGFEAQPSELHDILAVKGDSQCNVNYLHIAGLGDDFANLYIAEKEISRLRKTSEIPSSAHIYLHRKLLTDDLLSGKNFFEIKGLSNQNEEFWYF